MANPRKRVQVENLRAPEALQPTPIQSDRFTGAPRVSGAGDGYFQLAEALGSFSSALGAMNKAQQKKGQKDPTLQNQFAKLTQSQRAEVARTGKLPDGTSVLGNEHFGPGIMKGAGVADGAQFAQLFQTELLSNYDWTTGNVDEFLTHHANKYAAERGIADPFAAKGYWERVEQLRGWAREQEFKQRHDAAEKFKGDVTYAVMADNLNQWLQEDMPPADIHRQLRALYKDIGKHGSLGIDYNKLDTYTVDLAGNIAKTHPEVAIELLTKERIGAGPASAPLSSKLDLLPNIRNIVKEAQKQIVKNEADQAERNLHYKNFQRVRDGEFTAFEDVVIPDGTEDGRRITKQEQEEALANNVIEYTESKVADEKITSQQAAMHQLNFLRSMGLNHTYLKNEVDGIERRVDPSVVTDPNALADIEQRIKRYREYESIGKNYTRSQLSKETREFLDAIDIVQKYERYDMPRALLFAERVTNPTEGQVVSLARYRDTITDEVNSQFSSGFLFWKENPQNLGTYVARAESYATKLVAAGMDPEKAIKTSVTRMKENMVVYKGRAMDGLEQVPLADNWQQGLDSIIEESIKTGMSKDFEGQEVWPVVLSGGRMIFENEDGQIIKDKDGNVMAISSQLINRAANMFTAGDRIGRLPAEQKARKDAVKRQNRERKIKEGEEPGFLEREGISHRLR